MSKLPRTKHNLETGGAMVAKAGGPFEEGYTIPKLPEQVYWMEVLTYSKSSSRPSTRHIYAGQADDTRELMRAAIKNFTGMVQTNEFLQGDIVKALLFNPDGKVCMEYKATFTEEIG